MVILPSWARSATRSFGRVLLAGMILFAGASAHAQTHTVNRPAVLTTVTEADLGAAGTQLLLTFAPQAAGFTVTANDTNHPTIALLLTSRADSAAAPAVLRGLIKNIEFQKGDSVLVVQLTAGGPVHVTGTPMGDTQLSFTLSPAAPTATVAAVAGDLPKATDPPADQEGFELVPLKYADVSEVVGLLTDGQTVTPNDSFTPHEPAFGSAGMSGGGAISASLASNPEQADRPVGQSVNDSIGIDRRLNAVVLKGSPERIARLKAEIEAIDLPVQSVILETEFVELDETGARNVGIDYTNSNGQIATATYQTGGAIPSGFSTNHGLASATLQAAIYAQVQAGRGRIVSKPQIAAQSGGQAQIVTGDALPILTSITLSGVNGVSQQVQYVNVGVTLQIAPRVSSDGYVTSHVFCVVSSVTGYSQGYPTISQREASTSATVHDGETFVIGGLSEENDITNNSKVPGLGDIPVAGDLFKVDNRTKSKTELYIVVTPHVVRGSAPQIAEMLKQEARIAKGG